MYYGIDFETLSLYPKRSDDIVSVAVYNDHEKLFWYRDEIGNFIEWLKQHISDIFIVHNAKFDIFWVLYNIFGIKVNFEDTYILAWLVDENNQLSLDFLSNKFLGQRKAQKFDNLLLYDKERLKHYNLIDAELTYKLFHKLISYIKNDEKLLNWYNVEKGLVEVVYQMEATGVRIDLEEVNRQRDLLNELLFNLEKQFSDIAGDGYNMNSSQHLAYVLKSMGIDLLKSSKGNPVVSREALLYYKSIAKSQKVKNLIDIVLQYRKAEKLYSTYLFENEIIHPTFNQCGTVTGRFSSSNPNFQNIPREEWNGISIRKVFIPRDGYKFVDFDYSQMEICILAHYTNDGNLIAAIKSSDVHSQTAKMMFNLDCEVSEVKEKYKNFRQYAKTLNFGLMYGMSYKTLAKRLEISDKEAQKLYELYFKQFPKVKLWIQRVHNFVKRHRFIKTIGGRYRHLKGLLSRDKSEYSRALRQSVNSIIQGSAADIVKYNMLLIYNNLKNKYDFHILGQVHDEILFEVKEEQVGNFVRDVKDILENNLLGLRVPLKVEYGIGDNWEEVH